MKTVGELKITLEYKEGMTVSWHESINSISDGMGYGLTNLFSTKGAEDPTDFAISYFQLGQGSLSSYLPTQSTNKNFYSLASAFTTSDYGSSSTNTLLSLNQIGSSGGNFSSPVGYTTSSTTFVEIDPDNKSTFYKGGFTTRLIVDNTTANGKSISEAGLFMKNPDGDFGIDSPIMVSYKTFNPIQKTSDFRVIFDWNLFVTDGNIIGSVTTPQGDDPTPRLTFDFLSGTGEFQSGDEYSERFEFLIPPSYYSSGNPLVVAIHGLGQQMTQFRASSLLYNGPYGVKDRNWFYMAPLGRTTSAGPFFGAQNISGYQVSGNYYSHSPATVSNWNSIMSLNHLKKAVNYIINRYPIDRNRIYFVGFSAGGGGAVNYASKLTDLSTSTFTPAAVVALSPSLCMRRTWLQYAPSYIGSSIYWPLPTQTSWRDAAQVVSFVTEGQSNSIYLPSSLVNNNNNLITTFPTSGGVSSLVLSSTTPSTTPHYYNELNSIDYNLLTSSTFSPSTCTLSNIRHIPLYLQYCSDDSQGDFIIEPCNILSSLLAAGYHPNSQVQVCSYDSLSAVYGSAIGTHDPSSLNVSAALNFISSAVFSPPTQASTMVTRSGKFWYFDTILTPDIEGTLALSSTSSLGFIIWSIDRPTNTLWLSGTKNIKDVNSIYNIFNPDLAGFNLGRDNPLRVYNLSSSQFPMEGGNSPTLRRLGIPNLANPSQITYFNYSGSSIGATGVVCTLSGENWQAAGVGTVAARSGTTLLIRRVGYYEVIP